MLPWAWSTTIPRPAPSSPWPFWPMWRRTPRVPRIPWAFSEARTPRSRPRTPAICATSSSPTAVRWPKLPSTSWRLVVCWMSMTVPNSSFRPKNIRPIWTSSSPRARTRRWLPPPRRAALAAYHTFSSTLHRPFRWPPTCFRRGFFVI